MKTIHQLKFISVFVITMQISPVLVPVMYVQNILNPSALTCIPSQLNLEISNRILISFFSTIPIWGSTDYWWTENFVVTTDELNPLAGSPFLLLQCTRCVIKSSAICVFSVPISVRLLVQTNLIMCKDKDFSRWNKISVNRNANAGDVRIWKGNQINRWIKNHAVHLHQAPAKVTHW